MAGKIIAANASDLAALDYDARIEAVTVVTVSPKTGRESRQVDWSALALANALPADKPVKGDSGDTTVALYTLGANVPSEVFTGAVEAVKDVPGAVKSGPHGYPTLVQGRLGGDVRRILFGAYAPHVNYAQWAEDAAERRRQQQAALGAAMAGMSRGGMSKSALASLYERMMADPDFAETAAAQAFKAAAADAGVEVD